MKSLRLTILLLAVFLLLACNTANSDNSGEVSEAPAPGPVDIRGTITNLTLPEGGATDAIGVILIEGVKEEDTSYDRASVTITNQTLILDSRRNGEAQAVGFQTLEVGQRVEARFTGPILESYPVQTGAAEIVILGEK